MSRKLTTSLAVTFSLVLVLIFAWIVTADEVPRITKEEVKPMLDNADLIIIDVRTDKSWNGSESKI
jgi:hypothetical protein